MMGWIDIMNSLLEVAGFSLAKMGQIGEGVDGCFLLILLGIDG
jgi:hypothetical protein